MDLSTMRISRVEINDTVAQNDNLSGLLEKKSPNIFKGWQVSLL